MYTTVLVIVAGARHQASVWRLFLYPLFVNNVTADPWTGQAVGQAALLCLVNCVETRHVRWHHYAWDSPLPAGYHSVQWAQCREPACQAEDVPQEACGCQNAWEASALG